MITTNDSNLDTIPPYYTISSAQETYTPPNTQDLNDLVFNMQYY
jgi:hypothetical protein